mgnify:FL=1
MLYLLTVGKNAIISSGIRIGLFLSLLILKCSIALGQVDSISNAKSTQQYLTDLIADIKSTIAVPNKGFEELEINELIINSMRSKAGNDFFDHFTSDFEWPETNQSFIIVISEKPFRASTTQVIITVNDLDVFENVLQPRSSYLEDLADYAQLMTTQYILNYQQIMHDLDGEDRSGSGIY